VELFFVERSATKKAGTEGGIAAQRITIRFCMNLSTDGLFF
tara:strand:+ start:674 stop:796 length:123 start_codon:yes stop_codon:yes gene_type:complete